MINLLLRLKEVIALGSLLVLYLIPGNSSNLSAESSRWHKLAEEGHSHAPPYMSAMFFDSQDGVAITPVSIKKTADSGQSWSTLGGDDDDNLFLDTMAFQNKQTGLILGKKDQTPIILKTTNKGENWRKMQPNKESLAKLHKGFTKFFDSCFDDKGGMWAVGENEIMRIETLDNGWNISNILKTDSPLFSVACAGNEEVWAVGEKNEILHYSNNNWERKIIANNSFFTKIKITGKDLWLLGGLPSQGFVLRSQDNGQTWEDKSPENSNTLFDLYLKEKQGWLVGAGGAIYHTADNGNSWSRENSSTESDLINIFFLDARHGWITGDKSTVLKYEN
ncbi:MAG TPA: YCF48-related protein [Pyrinomonadaceae bacterium]|jgi:photosystem II stability/assembly factor-like uncharacterized protein|nr:YCF48-related protein [Pyrinomonadaceae bacterium]